MKKRRVYCSEKAKEQIRRAIVLIHGKDDYHGGMEILCRLAGIKVNKIKTVPATPAECAPPDEDAEGK